jgi:hypothetical protein
MPLAPPSSRVPTLDSCGVFNTTDITTNNGAAKLLTWDSETFDTAGMHSTTSNTDRITIQTAGLYIVNVVTFWDVDPDGVRFVAISKNDNGTFGTGTTISFAQYAPPAAASPAFSVSQAARFAVGDVLRIYVIQDAGGNLLLFGTNSGSPQPGWVVAQVAL